jgi:putative ABC transport system permease protein
MTLSANLRYSARTLVRTPALTLTLILTIAMGIGCNAAIVGFVRGLLTRDIPIPHASQLVSVFSRGARDSLEPVAFDDYLGLKDRRDLFALLGAARESRRRVVVEDRSSVMAVAAISPEFADLLQLSRGGTVLSYRVWENEFGSSPDARGSTIRVDGVAYQITGVAPDWLEGVFAGSAVDLWIPFGDGPAERGRMFWTIGRLAPGVSAEKAHAAIAATRDPTAGLAVLPYTGMTPEVASGIRRIGTLLTAAAVAVFFIACMNVAIFLLSRASARSRETSVRVALGASRRQLAMHVFSDSVLISIAGAACGFVLAYWVSHIIPAFLFDQDAERLKFVPDLAGSVAVAATCAAITVACGLMPMFEVRDDNPAAVLRRESAGPSRLMQRVRSGLVVAQMAGCCLLVISTAALIAGFHRALESRTGHRLRDSILATVQTRDRFDRQDLGMKYYRAAEDIARSIPGVTATAWSGVPPGSRAGSQPVHVERAHAPRVDATIDVVAFTPETLGALVMPPVAGRMFGAIDTQHSCRVAVVNEEAATDLFGGSAIGRLIEDPAGQPVEIIGVVAMRTKTPTEEPHRPTIFYYAQQAGTPLDRVGPARFRIPVDSEPARGVLETNVVSQSYFELMDMSPIDGTLFSDDPDPAMCRVGVINEQAAELYFGGHAVGGAIIDDSGRRTQIVGVVHAPPVRAAQGRIDAAIYFPMTQDFNARMTLILPARDTRQETLTGLQRRLEELPGGLGSPFVTTLEAHLSRIALAPERIATVLVGASAVTALILGVLGLYGSMAEAARQRRRETAVRLALGAQGWRVIGHVLAEGARLALTGAAAGMLGSLVVTRWLAQVTPGIDRLTLWIWLVAPLVLLGAVALASILPARQALASDPLTIMQSE